ncbi:hypothetical protein [uncultured Tateyamaria sp.]|uniref:hypothetical protein n=1 Tax=uncultured Tateyamaria sp. TaxID=455651 RepID=UPI002613A1B7|nr:hypothetical protein [uncultured Tateyamaria sp.]
MDIRGLVAAALGVLAGCTEPTPLSMAEILDQTETYDHWDVPWAFRSSNEVFQNVTQPDLVELLTGHTFVGYRETDRRGKAYGAIAVLHYGANGVEEGCLVDYQTGRSEEDSYAADDWVSALIESSIYPIRKPLLQITAPDGSVGYGNMQYKAETGQLAEIGVSGRYWVDVRKGHLQAGIPAGVYTACPEFPSAESLGTFVNETQTSWNYFELVKQDPGQRIHRPDLVTPFTAIPLDQVQGAAQ